MDDLNPEPTVEVLYKAQAVLAEAPFYEEKTGTLLWVDIKKQTINFLDTIAKTNRSVKCPDKVSAVIPVEGSDKLLVLLITKKQICLVDRNTGAVTDVLHTVDSEVDKPDNRLNDAKCDSSGRLWFGSMGKSKLPDQIDMGGGFYSYSAGVLTKHADAALSNGIGWNPSDDVLYRIDSYSLKLFSHSYNKQDGSLSNREALLDFTAQGKELEFADGMCTDTKGRLWVAFFGGQCVTCWDPNTKEKLLTVKIPGAKRITSCCFGGPNYAWLFVTSATFAGGAEELFEYPNSGHLFVIKDLGARGSPAHNFVN